MSSWVRKDGAALALLLAVGLAGVVAGSAWRVVAADDAAADAAPPRAGASASLVTAERAILAAWDRGRAAAYASADPAALARLYLPGSATGRRDVALVRAYAARGLRVVGLRMQVLDCVVLVSRPDRLTIRVTDRLHGARAVRLDGGGARALPVDRASRREVTFARRDGRWLVSGVRPARSR